MPYADSERNKECRRRYAARTKDRWAAYNKSRSARSSELIEQTWERCWRQGLMVYSGGTGTCVCCGEKREVLLTVDHIDGRQPHEKNSNFTGKRKMMRHLRAQGWPQGYQILCLNCNVSRFINGGVCEHQEPWTGRNYAGDRVEIPPDGRLKKTNKLRMREYHQQRRELAWREGIEEYGQVCSCCGQWRFSMLTLDHISGRDDGHESNRSGKKLWTILKTAGWPKGEIQLLCWNCNSCKGRDGICVHELERLQCDS